MDTFPNGAYLPQKVEGAIYKRWEASGFFNPDKLPPLRSTGVSRGKAGKQKELFSIIMPPPNANGALHIGHALFVTLQDIMTRFERMRGRVALWLPGADHAGIETEFVYRKKLEKEGKRWSDFSREELYSQIFEFTQKNKVVMENQLRKLGASCDWSREKFTLDADIVGKVEDSFVQMYQDGLIYRGRRIINWSVKDQTALSDLEIKYEERNDPLYFIKYGPLELATVRPETKFGDTAVAVNPKDKRYREFVGQMIDIETVLGPAKISVIADAAVDPEFGTGVVKVTPAHDAADFEIALRHNLEIKQVIDKYGRMNERAGPYQGMKVEEARKKVVEDMQAKGLVTKIDESYKHSVAVSARSGGIIEPMVIPQWFVKMTDKGNTKTSLRDLGVKAIKSKQIEFIPKRFEKVFYHWMSGLRDWNISRQISWGIRIPAWFCANFLRDEGAARELSARQSSGRAREGCPPIVSKEAPLQCPACGDHNLIQDPDVLDTWFSSGQWPFLALGYPDGKDFKEFYPTSVMETGWDIFFFWVARMIMLGMYRTGKVPFKKVYLHGLVRDQDRQKMSKSKGNVIDPLGVAELYGTDAVRMSLVVGNTPGNDPIISEDKIRGYRNFANKIWNASRFVLIHLEDTEPNAKKAKLTKHDKKLLKDLDGLTKQVSQDMEAFKFHHAAETLYHYFWHTFADTIIESAKPRLQSDDEKDREAAKILIYTILKTSLILLHPFMPYVTEAIWEHLPVKEKRLLMIEPWPRH
ncbi:MAG: valine--tRNA ligase [Candidatus Sungbacteria bacterium]|uniref:Valine--tRNA ligase n=1 Tax=Candidatus Sungiibacteriota bacterium TaxID=2750080 RepID=A0A9D6QS00_9BACT|nr:valine--tRNA ligase [Candidatus Sungbacteria bacterium]